MHKTLPLLTKLTLGILLLSSCVQAVSSSPGSISSKATSKMQSESLKTVTSGSGVTTAFMDTTSSKTQVMTISDTKANMYGLEVSFPPGSLKISSDILIEEGTPIATNVSNNLSLSDAQTASAAVIVRPSDDSVKITSPLRIALPLSSAKLSLSETKTLVVFYLTSQDGKTIAGVIPNSQIKLDNNKAYFNASVFGSFQLAYIADVIVVAKEAASTVTVVSKREEADAVLSSPLELSLVITDAKIGGTAKCTVTNVVDSFSFKWSSKRNNVVSDLSVLGQTITIPAQSAYTELSCSATSSRSKGQSSGVLIGNSFNLNSLYSNVSNQNPNIFSALLCLSNQFESDSPVKTSFSWETSSDNLTWSQVAQTKEYTVPATSLYQLLHCKTVFTLDAVTIASKISDSVKVSNTAPSITGVSCGTANVAYIDINATLASAPSCVVSGYSDLENSPLAVNIVSSTCLGPNAIVSGNNINFSSSSLSSDCSINFTVGDGILAAPNGNVTYNFKIKQYSAVTLGSASIDNTCAVSMPITIDSSGTTNSVVRDETIATSTPGGATSLIFPSSSPTYSLVGTLSWMPSVISSGARSVSYTLASNQGPLSVTKSFAITGLSANFEVPSLSNYPSEGSSVSVTSNTCNTCAAPEEGSLSIGTGTACYVTTSGAVNCFGKATSLNLGRAGLTTSNLYTAMPVTGITTAKKVSVSKSIGALYEFACALLQNGNVWCWGYNATNQLGNGTTADSLPASVVPAFSNVVAISTGTSFACALKSDGTVFCWGNGNGGSLGDGLQSVHVAVSPTPVMKDAVTNLGNIKALTSGSNFSCAIDNVGDVWCWGPNGNASGNSPTPQFAVKIAGVSGARQIAAGSNHVCAVTYDGSGYCWGDNFYSQFGNNNQTSSAVPQRVQSGNTPVTYMTNAVAVSLGDRHSCFILKTGELSCFGAGTYGQTGINSTVTSGNASFRVLALGGVGPAVNVKMVAAGPWNTAFVSNGNFYVTGRAFMGVLGQGTALTTDQLFPSSTPVASDVKVRNCTTFSATN